MAARFVLSNFKAPEQLLLKSKLQIKAKPLYEDKRRKQKRFKKNTIINTFTIEDGKIHLPFNFVYSWINALPNQKINYPSFNFNFRGSLLPRQEPVVEKSLSQLKSKHSCVLNLYPGFGKTVCATYMAVKLGLKPLVLMADNLIDNWKETFSDFLPETKVWVVTSSKKPPDHYDIAICMIGRVKYINPTQRRQFGTLIVDEAHQMCTQIRIEAMLSIVPRYIIMLSATFVRSSDTLHRALELIVGTERIVRRYEGQFSLYRFGSGIKANLDQCKDPNGNFSWNEYKKVLAESTKRNEIIANMAKVLVDHHFKVMVFGWLDEDHIQPLYKLIKARVKHTDYRSGNKGQYNDCQVLVNTISKTGTGFDEKRMCRNFTGKRFNVVILVGSLRNVDLLEQIVGRVFRAPDPIVFHYVDDDNISSNQWRQCRKYYLSTKATIRYIRQFDSQILTKNHQHQIDNQPRFVPPKPVLPRPGCKHSYKTGNKAGTQCGAKVSPKYKVDYCSRHIRTKAAREEIKSLK